MIGGGREGPVARQAAPVERQDKTVTVPEAARLLGKSADAIRSALRRGSLEGYRDNHGEWRIALANLPHGAGSDGDGRGDGTAAVTLDLLRQELDRTRAELQQAQRDLEQEWRQAADRQEDVAALRERVARLEGEAAGVRAVMSAKEAVIAAKDQTIAAKEEVIVALQERLNRRPWWRKLIGAGAVVAILMPVTAGAEPRQCSYLGSRHESALHVRQRRT